MPKLKTFLAKQWIRSLDPNLRLLASEIRKLLREEKDCVIGITGYPGKGKSNLGAILGLLIDFDYSYEKNICFIPTSKEITEQYHKLKMFSYFHIDEASKGLHKQKWYDKVQQTLNTLYDTEREGHFLCTALLMPRFQNFTENFRNFRIIYWINIVERGIAIAYRKDEDKDAKDPWHIDESYKKKAKMWKGKRIFERGIGDTVRMEQRTPNYWFYFKFPAIPEKVWQVYKDFKQQSREKEKEKETDVSLDSFRDRQYRERMDKYKKVKELMKKGYRTAQIAQELKLSTRTINGYIKDMVELGEMEGRERGSEGKKRHNILYNSGTNGIKNDIPEELDII